MKKNYTHNFNNTKDKSVTVNPHNKPVTTKLEWWQELSIHQFYEAHSYCSKEEWQMIGIEHSEINPNTISSQQKHK